MRADHARLHIRDRREKESGQDITPEITKVKVNWEFPAKSTGQVTVLWKIPLTSENMLENATGNPLEHAIENPRRFPRCRFLVCNILPLFTTEGDSRMSSTNCKDFQGRRRLSSPD